MTTGEAVVIGWALLALLVLLTGWLMVRRSR